MTRASNDCLIGSVLQRDEKGSFINNIKRWISRGLGGRETFLAKALVCEAISLFTCHETDRACNDERAPDSSLMRSRCSPFEKRNAAVRQVYADRPPPAPCRRARGRATVKSPLTRPTRPCRELGRGIAYFLNLAINRTYDYGTLLIDYY